MKIKKYMTRALALLFLAFVMMMGIQIAPQTFATLKGLAGPDRAGVKATVKELKSSYSTLLKDDAPALINRYTYVNINGLFARLMGQRIMNKVILMDNGQLNMASVARIDVTPAAEQIIEVYEHQKARGKAFLFVLAPYKVSEYENFLPPDSINHVNDNADALMALLDAAGVPSIDTREELHKDGIAMKDAFYNTDHHWTSETGFWAFDKIVSRLIEEGALPADEAGVTDIKNYDVKTYDKISLGFLGKRTGKYFDGLDDFSVIYPAFDTHLKLNVPSRKIAKEGAFAETVLNLNVLNEKYTFDKTWIYSYGTEAETLYENSGAPADVKMLTIDDSFGNMPIAYMSLYIKDIHQLDMRFYGGRMGEREIDFPKYFDEYDPDIVLMLTAPTELDDENVTYDFFE
jgi:hypothetical protein